MGRDRDRFAQPHLFLVMYQELHTSPPPDDDELIPQNTRLPAHSVSWSVYFSAILSILCLVANVIVSLNLKYPPSASTGPSSMPKSYTDIQSLRRPSSFIRFDEVLRQSPPIPRQFNNYPATLSQVDSTDRTKVFPVDAKRHMGHIGSYSPEDLRVLVNKNVSIDPSNQKGSETHTSSPIPGLYDYSVPRDRLGYGDVRDQAPSPCRHERI